MNQTDILTVETSFTLNQPKKPVIPGPRKKHYAFEKGAGNPINNYLKTPEEIEADFILETTAAQSLPGYIDTLNTYEALFKKRNDNTENSDTLSSGFMEENY